MTLSFVFSSQKALEEFGAFLARRLHTGDVVLLEGPLGAGKTTLVRAIVRALHGNDTLVASPTFSLLNLYDEATPPIYHYDLYRIESQAELYDLALEDALLGGVTLVEWPQKALFLLPEKRLEIAVAFGKTPEERYITCKGASPLTAQLESYAAQSATT